jgi:hypothetical protein
MLTALLNVLLVSGSASSKEATLHRLANTWSEFTAPANIYSLALSGTHVWFTDKSENLYYSALGGQKGILWRKVCSKAKVKSKSKSKSDLFTKVHIM